MDRILELINDLNSEDEKTRAFAAEDIAYDGLMEGFEPMLDRLPIEPSRFVREVIVNSLKSMNTLPKIEKLIPLLYSDDAFIRNASIDILSAQGEAALECLKENLSNPDKDIRKFVLDALIQINQSHSADLIAEALDDPDINNVITAVEYLGRLEALNYSAKINKLFLATDNILLRCTCLEVMALIGNNESIECVNKKYPNYQLISFLEQYSFLKFVAHKGSEIHLPLIIALMKDKGQVMHKEIINAIEGILHRSKWKHLPDELFLSLHSYLQANINDINKYELLVLLGEFDNEEIYPLLLNHASNGNRLICLGALEGLGFYQKKEAIPFLNELRNQVDDDEILETIDKSLAKLDK